MQVSHACVGDGMYYYYYFLSGRLWIVLETPVSSRCLLLGIVGSSYCRSREDTDLFVAAMLGVVLVLLMMVLSLFEVDFPAIWLCGRARRLCGSVAWGGRWLAVSARVRGVQPRSSHGWCSR
jgi:hypothetical protein